MNQTWLGIDFSGNRKQWTENAKQSNVWIATLHENGDGMRLASLMRPQELPGDQSPFDRLCEHLRRDPFDAAAIDAPFSIPEEYLPPDGHGNLIEAARAQSSSTPPFPDGKWIVQFATDIRPLASKKPLRHAERSCGVNVRSTLWNGPRGGAAFTAACLSLIGKSERPCWPWHTAEKGLLVEAFPALQLKTWGLQFQNYGKPEHRDIRRTVLSEIERRFSLAIDNAARDKMIASPDALDALVCCFAARAVIRGNLAMNTTVPKPDGCIALHK